MPDSPPLSFSSTKLPKPSHRRTISSAAPETSRNSSIQTLWANDYIADEVEHTPGSISPPPPATLTSRPFPRSIPLTDEEESHPARQPRTHQRSLTDLLPFRTSQLKSSHPQHSPIKEISQKEFEDKFMPTLTGDRDRKIKVSDKSKGGIAGWFSGSSAPVSLGVPVMEQEVSPSPPREKSPERTPTRLQKRATMSSTDSNSTTPSAKAPTTATSMFGSFFSPKQPTKTTEQQGRLVDLENDELLSLNIDKTLFPNGKESSFSPSSFNNLLMNAEGLLLRLQTAYKIRSITLNELQAEKEAQAEELEEANIRATSLRTQLEAMARRVTEQESTIKTLADELGAEKMARAEEREARERSIKLINSHRTSYGSITGPDDLSSPLSPKEKKWRESYASTDVSEAEDGLFSRSDSPAPTLDSSVMSPSPSTYAHSNASATEIGQATLGRVVPNPNHQKPKLLTKTPQPQPQQQSTFQKVLKSISSTPDKSTGPGIGLGIEMADGCSNCQGKDVASAWDTVGLLKAENSVLKERVADMEEKIDGAMDVVMGVGEFGSR